MKFRDSLFYCAILAMVLMTAVFLGMTIHWRVARNANTALHAAQLCVNCKELKPYYDPEDISRHIEALQQTDERCCGNGKDILRLSARKQIMEGYYGQNTHSYPHSINLLCESQVKISPYAKLVGITGTKPKEGHVKLLWNKDGKTLVGPTNQDITHLHDEGEVFIRRPGNYVVNINLVTTTNASSPNQQTMSHFIHVLSHKHGTQRILSEQRMSLNAKQQSFSTSGAVYRLDLHDRLSVATTHLEHVDLSSVENVFSVHLA